jgi:DNA-binding transcriptional regulator YdaS (Cro superfamily)
LKYSDVLSFFGSQSAIARALGIKQPSVNKWKTTGVPDGMQLLIEEVSGGVLHADSEAFSRHNKGVKATLSRNQNAVVACGEYKA